jgi:ppGpp synthetase/RelA/SpoT-type nucleotidyltranferase
MTGSKDQEKPKAEIERVLAEFDGKRDVLIAFAEKTSGLIQALLEDANIRHQLIQARVKDREKLKRKYLNETKNYRELNDITDQVALRVITYYEDEVDRVADIIKREFDVDSERSVDKRETEPDKFGYYALNYVCRYNGQRGSQPEYRKYAGVFCEIQIVSILRHAWSEIEHPWYDLKPTYPDSIRRRFARMAALLEIAESEFLNLRQIQFDYRRSVAVQVEANVPDLPVNAVSMKAFIEQDPLVAEIDRAIASHVGAGYEDKIYDPIVERAWVSAVLAGMGRLQDVRGSLKKYEKAIPDFVSRCNAELWHRPTDGAVFSKGSSIFQLSNFIVNLQGTKAADEFLKRQGLTPEWDMSREIAIAKEIATQYSY